MEPDFEGRGGVRLTVAQGVEILPQLAETGRGFGEVFPTEFFEKFRRPAHPAARPPSTMARTALRNTGSVPQWPVT